MRGFGKRAASLEESLCVDSVVKERLDSGRQCRRAVSNYSPSDNEHRRGDDVSVGRGKIRPGPSKQAREPHIHNKQTAVTD